MQTFLPYSSFENSARCLDRQRLGKQRIETLQILKTLAGENKGWNNHPAVKMWTGCASNLAIYGIIMCDEWIKRGYKDTTRDKIIKYIQLKTAQPSWLGNEKFHESHRSNLLRKNPEYYRQFNWSEPDNLPYYWPVPTALR